MHKYAILVLALFGATPSFGADAPYPGKVVR